VLLGVPLHLRRWKRGFVVLCGLPLPTPTLLSGILRIGPGGRLASSPGPWSWCLTRSLERALVGVVAGNKRKLNVSDIQAYITGHFGAPPGSFTVHPHHSEDFLALFYDTTLMVCVLHSPILLGPSGSPSSGGTGQTGRRQSPSTTSSGLAWSGSRHTFGSRPQRRRCLGRRASCG
jgi:hypothetical protein